MKRKKRTVAQQRELTEARATLQMAVVDRFNRQRVTQALTAQIARDVVRAEYRRLLSTPPVRSET